MIANHFLIGYDILKPCLNTSGMMINKRLSQLCLNLQNFALWYEHLKENKRRARKEKVDSWKKLKKKR